MFKNFWTGIVSFTPQILLAFIGLVFIAVFLPVLRPISSRASESVSISTACNGSNNRGLLIVHQFPDRDSCLRCQGDPTDCGRKLVGQPSDTNVCPAGNNYLGTTTNPYDGLPTTCSDTGSCQGSCSSSFPKCSVAQLDCLNGLGGGINAGNLQFNCDCAAPPPPTHKECRSNACVSVDGAGADNCPNNCQPETHQICKNNACATVPITQQGTACTTNSQCQPQTHMACSNMACVSIPGAGDNSCNVDGDCTVQTHKECRNLACTVVSGSGANQCNVSGDCVAANHNECRNNACVQVSGSGASTCSSNSDCSPSVQRAVCDSLSVSQNSGMAPVYVNSTLSGHTENGGSIVNFKFNFGDGSGDFNQSGNTLGHTFNSVGTYVISGTVTDNLGDQAAGASCQKVITVGQVLGVSTPPPAIPRTGPETAVIFSLLGSGGVGWVLKKFKFRT